MDLLEPLGRVMIVVLAIFGVLRLDLMWHSGALKMAFQPMYESMFLAEVRHRRARPIFLLAWPRVRRSRGARDRRDLRCRARVHAVPAEREHHGHRARERARTTCRRGWRWLSRSALMAIGVALFGLAVRFLPIFRRASTARTLTGREVK